MLRYRRLIPATLALTLSVLPAFFNACSSGYHGTDTQTSTPPGLGVSSPLLYGVNLAGAEFGSLGQPFGTGYIYPSAASFDYFQSKGLSLIRLPFLWERMQPTLNAPLDTNELARLRAVLRLAGDRGMRVIIDAHNYGAYKGMHIGEGNVPVSAYQDFWKRLASAVKDEPGLFGYGLMNEPVGFASTNGWPRAAQAGMDGVRAADTQTLVLVGGDCWSGAHSWRACNENLDVSDPANNMMYEAHQYMDADSSGTYRMTYDGEHAYDDVGVDRVKPFVEWLRAKGHRGFIGEYGVPDNDPRWLVVLNRFLLYLNTNCVGGTYWAAGPWWGSDRLAVEPVNGADRPQMTVLSQYTINGACTW